jgi:hypothetical protein
MGFPSTPLGIVGAIALGADPVDPAGWNFTDISDDIRSAGRVTITAGRQDETGQVDATRVGAVVDNETGDYCRVNPLGAYYGSLSRGTPLEVRVTRIADTFTRTTSPGLGTDSVSGLVWTHSSSSAWATTGSAATCTLAAAHTATYAFVEQAIGADVEVTGSVSLSAVTTGAAWVHTVVARVVDLNNQYRLHVEFGTTGVIGCKIAKLVDGSITDLTAVVSTSVAYLAGTVIQYRARVVGSTLQLRAWEDGTDEPTTWTCEADDDAFPEAGVTGIYSWRVAGNTNVGSLVSTFDDFRVDVIRSITPVPEWPVRWDQSGNDVTAPITGAGILRRLSQGQSALRSPMYRQIVYPTRTGHWPLEDGSDATRLTNTVAAGTPGTLSGASPGNSEAAPGASSAVQTPSGALLTGVFTAASTTAGWQIAWSCKLAAAAPGSNTEMIRWSTSNGHTWSFQVSTTNFTLVITDNTGATVDTMSSSTGSADPTDWLSYRVKATVSGGTVTVEPAWFGTDGVTPLGFTDTYAGTLGRLTGWRIATTTATTDALWSHVFGVTTGADDLQSYDARRAFDGYAGETAGARLVRLCGEEGVPLTTIGDTAETALMGAQTSAVLLDLLRECEAADQGVLHERGAGLGYLTREARYNGDPVMELDFTSGHVAAPPEPTDDDQRLRNRVVLRRTGGSEVTVEDEASIAVDGVYADELDVNLEDDGDLEQHAYWRLHLGTLDGLRWPRIELDLARNPDLIDEWCKVRVGSRITIANPPDQVGTDDLDLIVEGWTETLAEYEWTVVMACSPADPWDVAVYDDADARYDSRSTVLKTAVNSSATALTFRTSDPLETWSTTETPYDVVISGERITVTAMGAASLVSGAYDQAATVTRSINGIIKALPASAEIHVAPTPRYAL